MEHFQDFERTQEQKKHLLNYQPHHNCGSLTQARDNHEFLNRVVPLKALALDFFSLADNQSAHNENPCHDSIKNKVYITGNFYSLFTRD